MDQKSLFHNCPSWVTDKGLFASLNSCPCEWAIYVRSWLDNAFSHYPSTHSKDLHSRFTSGKDFDFRSAYFEIVIYTLLRSTGHAVKVHPEISGSNKYPDFLVKTSDNHSFVVVEAKTILKGGDDQHALTEAEKNVIKHLESFKDDLFYYHVAFTGKLEQYISKASIKRAIDPLCEWGRENYEILKSGNYIPEALINEAIYRDKTSVSNNDRFANHILHINNQ